MRRAMRSPAGLYVWKEKIWSPLLNRDRDNYRFNLVDGTTLLEESPDFEVWVDFAGYVYRKFNNEAHTVINDRNRSLSETEYATICKIIQRT